MHFSGGRVASYAEIRCRTSQLIQAQRGRGRDAGEPCRRPVEEPSGGPHQSDGDARQRLCTDAAPPVRLRADHAYVIGDAEIDCLVFDTDNFTERARQLEAQYPDLTLLGFGPNDVGDDYLALADEFEPEPCS